MLSEAERAAIDAERQHYPDVQAISIDALKIVQEQRGWVSDDALSDIADYLGISRADLEGVATFYNLIFRQPVGRNVIMYCDSVSCFVMGCDQVRDRLCGELGIQPGETTPDNRYTLLPVVCLGACDHAPVLMVNKDLHHDVDTDQIADMLEPYQ